MAQNIPVMIPISYLHACIGILFDIYVYARKKYIISHTKEITFYFLDSTPFNYFGINILELHQAYISL